MARLISTKYVELHSIPGSIHSVREIPGVSPGIRGYRWNADEVEEFSLEPDQLDSWKVRRGFRYWLDITGFRSEAVLQSVSRRFELHPLTLEDIANSGHSPKIDEFGDYRFIIMKMLRLENDRILSEQLCIVQRRDLIITFQEAPGDVFESVRRRLAEGIGRIRGRGGDYALFSILDALVDNYIRVAEFLGNGIEDFEDAIFDRQDRGVIAEIRRAKTMVGEIRRYSQPFADSLERVMLSKDSAISADDRPFFADLKDHLDLVNGAVNGYREMLRDQLNLYTALQNNRLSEVMKVLTVISTIFIPLTFMAGIYGMNFRFMPELSFPFAYPLLLGIMALIALGMLIYFRRKGWLGRRGGRSGGRSAGKRSPAKRTD
jgi:magnesium transporter